VFLSIHRFAPTPAAKLALALDLAVLAAAVLFATSGAWWVQALSVLCAVLVFWGTSSVVRHYGSASERPLLDDLLITLLLLLAVSTVVGLGGRAFGHGVPSVTTMIAVALPVLVLLRTTIHGVLQSQGRAPRQILIIGAGPLGRITGEDLGRKNSVCSFLTWPEEVVTKPLPGAVLGLSRELPQILNGRPFDEVYLCGFPDRQSAVQEAVNVCETYGVPFALPAYSVRLGRAQPVASKAVADGFLHYVTGGARPEHRALKRLLDITGSAAGLWVLFPFLLMIAALVKLTSRGPVFFRQVRVGLHGKKFNMLKFRSMVSNAEALKSTLAAQNEQKGPVFKMKHDPRVTPLGRILRKYSIDELPQLVNVLRGDMTLVGPRPPVPQEVAQYEPWQHRRLSVPPGLTCLWQVSGRNEVGFEDWMYLDLQYIDNWSMGQDIGLILKTVPAVVTGRGSH
jgi:exopolysaccharide biosynthesis polyprenyl glycosylphosphotransferase